MPLLVVLFFFFNDTATTEIYTLSLHDALPIYARRDHATAAAVLPVQHLRGLVLVADGDRPAPDHHGPEAGEVDRKSTRLNSSHSQISYAVFCLKKKKKAETRCDLEP